LVGGGHAPTDVVTEEHKATAGHTADEAGARSQARVDTLLEVELILRLSYPPSIPPTFVVRENPVSHIVPMPFGLVEWRFAFWSVQLFGDICTRHSKSVRLGSCFYYGNWAANEERLEEFSFPAF
jgi:hypothetical protein